MSAMDRQLLTRIGKVPAGERLPLSAFARDLDATVSVIMTAVQSLVEAGKLDRDTLRPPIAAGTADHATELSPFHFRALALMADGPVWIRTLQSKGLKAIGDQLVAMGFAERHAPPPSRYRNMLRLTELGRAQLPPESRRQDAEVLPTSATSAGPADTGSADTVGGGDARSNDAAPANGETVGQRMARDLLAAWDASGMPITLFFAPLTRAPQAFLSALRKSRTNKAETIDKVVAFLADPPKATDDERAARAQAKAAPKRPPHPPRMALGPEAGANVERRRIEAIEAAERRRGGETVADAIRRCGREVEAEDADTTTGLPRKREFPAIPADSWSKLAALAGEMGKRRSEVLVDVIDAGILCVTEDLREGER